MTCSVCGGAQLADRPALRRYGLTRADIDRVFTRCPVVAIDGSRKVYVRWEDVHALLREYPVGSVRRQWEAA